MTNRLAGTASPYLLQHAENPVDWYPWGAESLARARSLDRPIFLSIGYAACHWCHVMAHESFEDVQVAALLNEHFVSIKVDREERPDLDSLYMDAVVALTGQGGWPMSVFLTPDGRPFYGGTYFPPTARHGLPAFRQVLEAVARAWVEDRARLLRTGDELTSHLSSESAPPTQPGDLQPAALARATERLFAAYDWTDGGWGPGPKFPQPMAIEFLLRRHHRDGDALALDMAGHALRSMAHGGIFDQAGGGFHRYATDKHWRIPHFEKMLYDNALLSRVYLHAWQVSGDLEFRRTVEATLDFSLRELALPDGGFASSLDADSGTGEGDYYLWSREQVSQALGDETRSRLAWRAFGVTEEGDLEGRSVLRLERSPAQLAQQAALPEGDLEALLSEIRPALATARAARPRPARDDKVVAEWNGLLLSALAEAGGALERPDYLDAARRLGDFAARALIREGRLARSWRDGRLGPPAFLSDHASLGLGLLALYQADFEPRWFETALHLADLVLARFGDPRGGLFDTADDHEALIARPKSLEDNATPSGHAQAMHLFLQLEALTGEPRYGEPAARYLHSLQAMAAEHPLAFSAWLGALDLALGPQLQLAIVGRPAEAGFAALAGVAHAGFQPRMVLAAGDPEDPAQPALLRGRTRLQGRPAAYLCRSFTCRLPTASPDELRRQLTQESHPPRDGAPRPNTETDVQ